MYVYECVAPDSARQYQLSIGAAPRFGPILYPPKNGYLNVKFAPFLDLTIQLLDYHVVECE